MSDELPSNAEPTPSPPGSSMYFEVTTYQPDGGAPFLGVLLTLGLLLPGGVLAGWLLSALIPWAGPVFFVLPEKLLFLILFLAFFGVGVAALFPGRWGLRWGRIRSPFVAAAAALFGVGVIAVTLGRCEYDRLLAQPNIDWEEAVISWLGYAVGAVALSAFAVWGFRAIASAPFCTQCNTWKVTRHKRHVNFAPDFLLRAVTNGDIIPLADHDLSRDQGDLVVEVATCPRCGEDVPVEVKVQQVTVTPKGQRKVVDLAHTSYPGQALRVFDALFELRPPKA
jgi:hypothetical protein